DKGRSLHSVSVCFPPRSLRRRRVTIVQAPPLADADGRRFGRSHMRPALFHQAIKQSSNQAGKQASRQAGNPATKATSQSIRTSPGSRTSHAIGFDPSPIWKRESVRLAQGHNTIPDIGHAMPPLSCRRCQTQQADQLQNECTQPAAKNIDPSTSGLARRSAATSGRFACKGALAGAKAGPRRLRDGTAHAVEDQHIGHACDHHSAAVRPYPAQAVPSFAFCSQALKALGMQAVERSHRTLE
ncbi:hypothetical protein JHW43_009330, partial [Diplocarpon mali]